MKKELNISEILKNKPKGIRLYSPIFGDCTLSFIQGVTDAICVIANDNREFFDYKGLYSSTGECLLFPSKLMRDWNKFSWKKGDVLVSNDGGTEVIFDKWYDETYTSFYCKHFLNSEDENNIVYNEAFVCTTERYSHEDKDTAKTYINTIEERLGGKLNRETLEIEKPKTDFKDGDVLFVRCMKSDFIEIFNYSKKNGDLYDHASLNTRTQDLDISGKYKISKDDIVKIRLATEEEKKQLFNALAKEGKVWIPEKKQIVDLKPKIEFKPFDKVLVRNYYNEVWKCDFYSFNVGIVHCCIINGNFRQCIPYNEGTEKLIDTTNNWEG